MMLGSTYLGISVPQHLGTESEMYCLSEHSKENAEHSRVVGANSYAKGW